MICVVDDDISVLRSLQELLASDGLEAQTFDDPEKFLDYTRTHNVKLAVLDYAMPALNGLQLQDRLHVQSSDTKVIIITGRDEPAIRATASKGGAFAFLIKPFDDETFLDAVNSALDQ
jgi:FixJ family two-component response regulator